MFVQGDQCEASDEYQKTSRDDPKAAGGSRSEQSPGQAGSAGPVMPVMAVSHHGLKNKILFYFRRCVLMVPHLRSNLSLASNGHRFCANQAGRARAQQTAPARPQTSTTHRSKLGDGSPPSLNRVTSTVGCAAASFVR